MPGERTREVTLDPGDLCGHSGQKQGPGAACPDRTRAIPCTVRAVARKFQRRQPPAATLAGRSAFKELMHQFANPRERAARNDAQLHFMTRPHIGIGEALTQHVRLERLQWGTLPSPLIGYSGRRATVELWRCGIRITRSGAGNDATLVTQVADHIGREGLCAGARRLRFTPCSDPCRSPSLGLSGWPLPRSMHAGKGHTHETAASGKPLDQGSEPPGSGSHGTHLNAA